MGDKRKDTAPPLIKQVWEFSQNQLEQVEKRDRRMAGTPCLPATLRLRIFTLVRSRYIPERTQQER